jgi:hypothetical protein
MYEQCGTDVRISQGYKSVWICPKVSGGKLSIWQALERMYNIKAGRGIHEFQLATIEDLMKEEL